MNVQNHIQRYVDESPLTEDEKQTVAALFLQWDDDLLENFSKLLEEYPWLIPYVYVNFAAKKYAFEKNDVKAFKQILEKEEKLLSLL